MSHMTKRVHMKPANAGAERQTSLWPLIITGYAVVVTLSWMDSDGSTNTASEFLHGMHLLAQQWLDTIRENLHQL